MITARLDLSVEVITWFAFFFSSRGLSGILSLPLLVVFDWVFLTWWMDGHEEMV